MRKNSVNIADIIMAANCGALLISVFRHDYTNGLAVFIGLFSAFGYFVIRFFRDK